MCHLLRYVLVFIKFELNHDPFLTCKVFAADMLYHAMTLTFAPVILNICSKSDVM